MIDWLAVVIAIFSLYAYGSISRKLNDIDRKLDRTLESFDGLRHYLYEIDPQFDDERESQRAFDAGDSMFSGMDDLQLVRAKEASGKRTLNTPL